MHARDLAIRLSALGARERRDERLHAMRSPANRRVRRANIDGDAIVHRVCRRARAKRVRVRRDVMLGVVAAARHARHEPPNERVMVDVNGNRGEVSGPHDQSIAQRKRRAAGGSRTRIVPAKKSFGKRASLHATFGDVAGASATLTSPHQVKHSVELARRRFHEAGPWHA